VSGGPFDESACSAPRFVVWLWRRLNVALTAALIALGLVADMLVFGGPAWPFGPGGR
jgi:hypothetical protein